MVARQSYAIPGDVAESPGSFRSALRRRFDLPRNTIGELVPGLFDGLERPGSGARRTAGPPLAYQISGRGWQGISRGGDYAAGNHAWRHGCGRASGRRTIQAVGWQEGADPNDFEVGKRHKLAEIDVMTDDGKMSAAAGSYAGMDRFAARKRVVEELQKQGALEKITDHANAIGLCERSKTVVEPRISTQWFCKMKPLAEPAIAAVERGEILMVPDNRREEYFNWMRNIRDWTLSRQLWWGPRIPAWRCKEHKHITVAREIPAKRATWG